MGHDKALLVYDGEPQLVRAERVLASVCARVLVSVRPDQVALLGRSGLRPRSSSSDFDLVVDELDDAGPVAGLLAAWQRVPNSALLVLAVDLPLVDVHVLHLLLEARDPSGLATAFEHPDGTLEPLCTVWEPAAQPILRARARNSNVSLRRVLESSTVKRIKPLDAACIRSVNTPDDDAELRGMLEV
jgi:molybdopterin-guanine dinucleotide biosynthesis protein A